jgi:subtilase family serine protease
MNKAGLGGTARCRRRPAILIAAAGVSCVVALTAGSTAGAGGKVPVPQGIGAAALPASAFGDTDPSTPETVSFVLQAQRLNELEALVEAGMPHGFLSVGDFADRYGQSSKNVAALESYLATFGISSTALADNLDVVARGTAGQFDQALSVQQQEFELPPVPPHDGHPGRPGQTVHGTKQSPLLPRELAKFVLAVLGLTNYPTAQSERARIPFGKRSATVQAGDLTPEDFAKLYHVDPLYEQGATGAGRTIGIVTLASVDPAVPQTFWNDILGISTKPNRIQLVDVDGGSGPVSDAAGSGETTLDVEQSGALAPQANILVYQAPPTDFGFVDAFFRAASDDVADTVSTSWGSSESVIRAAVASGQESAGYEQSFDEAFLELAAQGQSAFSATGDFGAYSAIADLGTTNLDAGNPDGSPWITAAGGTTLPGIIPLGAVVGADPNLTVQIPSERTWGWDWIWPTWQQLGFPDEFTLALAAFEGAAGGYSLLEPMPDYQRGVPGTTDYSAVEYLTPTDFSPSIPVPPSGAIAAGLTFPTNWDFNPTPQVIKGHGDGRATPDLSANADPFTGYLLYFTFGDQAPTLQAGWGGTSFTAQQFAGVGALMDSLLGRRIGFWNPWLYRFSGQGNSPFTPLDESGTSNDNLFYTGTPGHVFNAGSGLGTPDFAKLAADFASLRH